MLKDSRSYEVQIIDAVRSVNKALGGTYGTSSAIYKNEFNQYEVQLIDAIKGIGRTLSGNGLSLVAGGGGASSEELQDLSRRMSKLEGESFFRLVDGNVTLKEQYQNLWVPGWLAAGGVGSGGGGGGGSYTAGNGIDITNGVISLKIASSTTLGGVKVGTGLSIDAFGNLYVTGGGGSGTVTGITMNGQTYSPSPNGLVDIGTVVTYETDPTVPAWAKESNPSLYIGTTRVQTSSANQALTGITSINATSSSSSSSRIVWESANNAWHVYGNLYADGWVAAGGIGSGGGGGGGSTTLAGLSDVSLSSPSNGQSLVYRNGTWRNELVQPGGSGTVTSVGMTVPTGLSVSPSTITTSGTFAVSLANGYVIPQQTTLDNYVTLTGTTQTISGAKVFTDNDITLRAISILPFTTATCGLGSSSKRFDRVYSRDGNFSRELKLSSSATLYIGPVELSYDDTDLALLLSGTGGEGNDPVGFEVGSNSFIDIGDARLEYDSDAYALRITKKAGGSRTIGLYADGFVSAGGVAASASRNIVFTDGTQNITGTKSFSNLKVTNLSAISSDIALTGTINALSITKDNNNYVTLNASRIDIQDNGNNLFLCRGNGKVFLCANPGGTVSQKLYLDSSSTAIAQSWNTHSDIRLKDDIATISGEDAIRTILALNPVSWTWKTGGKASGLIAQEVEKVIPFMVTEGEYKGLAYQMLHAYEISALQSHEERISALEKKLND